MCKTSLLNPSEVAALTPCLSSEVIGGLYTTNDGYINARALNRALIKGAINGGTQVIAENMPQFIRYDKVGGT